MISRYALFSIDQLRDRFRLDVGLPKGVKPHYNISPTREIPVIIQRDGQRMVERMIWGFIPQGAKDMTSVFRYKTYAVRSEKILETHTYRAAIRTKRCIIPVDGFYDWRRSASGKQAFYLRPRVEGPFGFAGVYSTWTDSDGNAHNMCAIITIDTDTPDEMTPSRLPIIVDPTDESSWLNSELTDLSTLYQIMRPGEKGAVDIIPVGDEINSTKANSPTLIRRLIR